MEIVNCIATKYLVQIFSKIVILFNGILSMKGLNHFFVFLYSDILNVTS